MNSGNGRDIGPTLGARTLVASRRSCHRLCGESELKPLFDDEITEVVRKLIAIRRESPVTSRAVLAYDVDVVVMLPMTDEGRYESRDCDLRARSQLGKESDVRFTASQKSIFHR